MAYDKPETASDAHEWHEFTFRLSIDRDVDWDDFDIVMWSKAVARYTAQLMAKTDPEITAEQLTVVRASLIDVEINKLQLVTDDDLNKMIDTFGEE